MDKLIDHTKFREARERLGYSLQDVATELEATRGLICQYESGRATPTGERLVRLCRFLRLTLDDISPSPPAAAEGTPAPTAVSAS